MPMEVTFSVVIPTYNRAHIVGRALDSILNQGIDDLEIIVVDDFSTDNTKEFILTHYPQVCYVKQECNMGPSMARNRGILTSTRKWVVMLDDDDQLLPGALKRIMAYLRGCSLAERYPVFQFPITNATVPAKFLVANIDTYLNNVITGDFIPIIQKDLFLKMGLAFPKSTVGAEHLLWWQVADRVGIPTWNYTVAKLNTDAPGRLTDISQQIKKAKSHAQAQEMTLSLFGEIMEERAPRIFMKKQIGAVIYWLLAGERLFARRVLKGLQKSNPIIYIFFLFLSYMPIVIIRSVFVCYRRLTL